MQSHPGLTPAQRHVLTLLATGSTAIAAARSAGVHRNTVGNWLRSPAFRDAFNQARRDQDLAWSEQARSLVPQAVAALQAIFNDPQAPAVARLQAALAVRSSQPTETGRNQPCPCGSGRKFKHCCMSTR